LLRAVLDKATPITLKTTPLIRPPPQKVTPLIRPSPQKVTPLIRPPLQKAIPLIRPPLQKASPLIRLVFRCTEKAKYSLNYPLSRDATPLKT
jgi:hypothetical protein